MPTQCRSTTELAATLPTARHPDCAAFATRLNVHIISRLPRTCIPSRLAPAVPLCKVPEKRERGMMVARRALVFPTSLLVKTHAKQNKKKRGDMKKLFALVVLSLCMAAPSFAADV